MVLFRRQLYERFRGGLPALGNSLIGQTVSPAEDVPPRRTLPGAAARLDLECGKTRVQP